jgi:hypothetical protein
MEGKGRGGKGREGKGLRSPLVCTTNSTGMEAQTQACHPNGTRHAVSMRNLVYFTDVLHCHAS